MPLDKIREITSMIDTEGGRGESGQDDQNTMSRIVHSAIDLFRLKGYETVTISEIVAAAQIGCSTFYKCFSNKKELLIACIHEIISNEDIRDDGEEIADQKDVIRFFEDANKIYRKTSPAFRAMMDQLHAAAINDPAEFAEKMDEVIQYKLRAFEERIQNGIEKGVIRNLDKTVLAVMLYGIEEATYQYSTQHKLDESQKDVLSQAVMDILLHGIMKN